MLIPSSPVVRVRKSKDMDTEKPNVIFVRSGVVAITRLLSIVKLLQKFLLRLYF